MELHANINSHQLLDSASQRAQAKQAASVAETEKTPSTSDQVLSNDKVELSEEGKSKSMDEKNQAALRKMMGKGDVDESEESVKDPLDDKIAELKQKIADLTRELAEIRNRNDEDSMEKAKALETEINVLTAQLIELLNKKKESMATG